MPEITTFLTYQQDADQAVRLYLSIFDGKIVSTMGGEANTPIVSLTFQMLGKTYVALNGGPSFTFSEGISLLVSCETQEEVDRYWAALTADGGKESQCGWLKDKFGVSWQIIPKALGQYLGSKDRDAAGRALQAMLKMKKIDILALKRAYEGK
jgi:predicted 3-demethylubiquinone-9 3-methyltransferase (glyoxalase superfamily)